MTRVVQTSRVFCVKLESTRVVNSYIYEPRLFLVYTHIHETRLETWLEYEQYKWVFESVDIQEQLLVSTTRVTHCNIHCNTLQQSNYLSLLLESLLVSTTRVASSRITCEWVRKRKSRVSYIYGVATIIRLPELHVSFAKEPYKRDYNLQKRRIIVRSQLSVATPYEYSTRVKHKRPDLSLKLESCLQTRIWDTTRILVYQRPRWTGHSNCIFACSKDKSCLLPHQKLLGDGFLTPVPLFCLICSIISNKTGIFD